MPNVSIVALRGAARGEDSAAVNSYEANRQDGITPRLLQKVCARCKQEKLCSKFSPRKEGCGLNSWCKSCCNEKFKEYRAANLSRYNSYHRVVKTRYRMKALEKLAGRPKPDNCEVCGRKGIISFDHDHVTMKFRGWICNNCNMSLGLLSDSPELLRKLAEYLEKSHALEIVRASSLG